jgi:copper homeostasis protein
VKVMLEIAVSTPDEAVIAARAGADRLELCSGLEVGGLTPSLGILGRVKELVSIPVWVLIRPRPGGFLYSHDELESIRRDAETILAAGADGLVVGALDAEGMVADTPCRTLAAMAQGCIAFHRAFDFAKHPHEALDRLVCLGFRRILTSGAQKTAFEGTEAIAELIRRAAGQIEIMPGGGIRADHVSELVRKTGCHQVHAAARTPMTETTLERNRELAEAMGAPSLHSSATDADLVAALREELDRLTSLT